MKLVLIKFAKADDGSIASRLKDVLAPVESYLKKVSGGQVQRVTNSFDGSLICWFVNVRFASRELVNDLYGVEFVTVHDEILVTSLEAGRDHSSISLNVALSWLGKHLAP